MEDVAKNLNSKVRRGSLKTIKFLLLGYPQPQTYAERLDQPDRYWKNYTDYLPVLSEDVYWTVEVRRNLTCADTGLIRLVILDENMRHIVNVEDRTPLIGRYPYWQHLISIYLPCTSVTIALWWISGSVKRQHMVIHLQMSRNLPPDTIVTSKNYLDYIL